VNTYQSGKPLPAHVNHYITDGEVAVASLTPPSANATPA
jgi:hypothetical protein